MSFISNPLVREWCKKPLFYPSLICKGQKFTKDQRKYAQITEKDWGNSIISQTKNGNWTTKLGETIVKEMLEACGKVVTNPRKINKYQPDWETVDAIWEVKTSNWCVSGTAGEKILGVPWKYAEIPKLYKKPLFIVCVAYQEWEAEHVFNIIGNNNLPIERKKQLELWNSNGIYFIGLSDLFKYCTIKF